MACPAGTRSYFFGRHVLQVLTHHDAPEFGFDETLRPLPFGRPGEKSCLGMCRTGGGLWSAFTETPAAPGQHGARLGHVLPGAGMFPGGCRGGQQTEDANGGGEAHSLLMRVFRAPDSQGWRLEPRGPQAARGPAVSGSCYPLTHSNRTNICKPPCTFYRPA